MSTAPLDWQAVPYPGDYINSVATDDDGDRVVAGTFFHSYGDDTERRTGVSGDTGTYGIYCWNAQGALQWSNTFAGYQGVYWVTLSGDGAWAASGGWYAGAPDYQGFIAAFDAAGGAVALDYYRTPSRVNQVALSKDGSLLAAAGDKLYWFVRSGNTFPSAPQTFPVASGDSVISIGMSADGQWLAAGTYNGQVILLQLDGSGGLHASKTWAPPQSDTVHSVAMATQGAGFAVGMKNGQFFCFDCADFIANGQPAWSQTLAGASSVYGVAIAADASFVSAVGNLGDSGGIVAVYDNAGTSGTLRWQNTTLAGNPNSTSIDQQGLFVAVADGHPDGTPGHFTLFNAGSGDLIWSYTTGNMSWPIQLAGDAMSCVAGSDDSHVYRFSPLRLLCG